MPDAHDSRHHNYDAFPLQSRSHPASARLLTYYSLDTHTHYLGVEFGRRLMIGSRFHLPTDTAAVTAISHSLDPHTHLESDIERAFLGPRLFFTLQSNDIQSLTRWQLPRPLQVVIKTLAAAIWTLTGFYMGKVVSHLFVIFFQL